MKQCSGVLSIDDPYLHKYLANEGPLMKALTDRRRTSNCVIYGRTLNTYALIQGLLNSGVRPSSIILAIPEPSCHIDEYNESDEIMRDDLPVIYPDAFEDENIEVKIQSMLEEMGITIYKQVKLMQIFTDKDKDKPEPAKTQFGDGSIDSDEPDEVFENANLERLLFKKLNEVDDEEEEDEDEDENRSHSDMDDEMGGRTGEDGSAEEDKSQAEEGHHEKKKRRKKNELELDARVLVTCGHRDVDPDVFKSIHDNGLVYNGRLIVDRHF